MKLLIFKDGPSSASAISFSAIDSLALFLQNSQGSLITCRPGRSSWPCSTKHTGVSYHVQESFGHEITSRTTQKRFFHASASVEPSLWQTIAKIVPDLDVEHRFWFSNLQKLFQISTFALLVSNSWRSALIQKVKRKSALSPFRTSVVRSSAKGLLKPIGEMVGGFKQGLKELKLRTRRDRGRSHRRWFSGKPRSLSDKKSGNGTPRWAESKNSCFRKRK